MSTETEDQDPQQLQLEEGPSKNTRSAYKDCKKCDFCLIKKKLTELNQMITCPLKAQAKKIQDELNPPTVSRKTKRVKVEEVPTEPTLT